MTFVHRLTLALFVSGMSVAPAMGRVVLELTSGSN